MGHGCCGGGGGEGHGKAVMQGQMSEQQEEIAKWVRWNVKTKEAPVKGGDKRAYFMGQKAVDKIMESKFATQNAKDSDKPTIPDREHAVAMMNFFMRLGLFYRGEREYLVKKAKRIRRDSNGDTESETEEERRERKKKKFRLDLCENQTFFVNFCAKWMASMPVAMLKNWSWFALGHASHLRTFNDMTGTIEIEKLDAKERDALLMRFPDAQKYPPINPPVTTRFNATSMELERVLCNQINIEKHPEYLGDLKPDFEALQALQDLLKPFCQVSSFCDNRTSAAGDLIPQYLGAIKKMVELDLNEDHGKMLEPFILSAIDYLVGSAKREPNKRGAPIVSRADILPVIGYMLRIPNRKCSQLTTICDLITKSPHVSRVSKEKIIVIFVELARDWENDCFKIVRELFSTFEHHNQPAALPAGFADEDLNCAGFLGDLVNVDAKTKLEREITRFKNFEIETYFEWSRTNMNIPKCIEFLDSHTFPMLAKVIRIAFQTPAGTGNLERFFRTLKYIFTTERSRMSEETLSNEFSMHGRALFHDYIQSLKE